MGASDADRPDRDVDGSEVGPKSSESPASASSRRQADQDAVRQMWRMAGLGVELAAAVGGMALIGWLIDRWRGSLPLWTLVFLAMGFVGGLWNLFKTARRNFRG
jgi:F0F1-type ATP synthase assembly protein I